jgi:cytidine deaminase
VDAADLIAAAAEAAANAYAPYSGFRVGAVVLARDGRVFAGANVENASYGLSLCAERAALACAAAAGVRPGEVATVAVTAAPCGACRQWLAEFAADRVLYGRPDGSVVSVRPDELLPDAFRLEP